MARKYQKRSAYWKNINKTSIAEEVPLTDQNIDYHSISLADSSDNYARLGSSFSSTAASLKFPNLSKGILPYENNGNIITITDAIKLCQLAYANVSIVRNTIDTCSEFSNTKIHIKTDNESVKRFFEKWLEKINIWKLGDQFFREYYKSGNVFIYRFDGKFDTENFNALKSIFAIKSNSIPIAYTFLNPAEIGVEYTPLGYGSYVKMFSLHEIGKLRDSEDPAVKEFVNKLDMESRDKLYSFVGNQLYMTIDPNRLSFVFYKKQDYEPLALPMVYPVLDDIEWKLSLKNMDKQLAKSVDNIILLVTMGEQKNQYGGGINYNHIAKMQQLFRNRAAGRVIVSDYTMKAEFIVPSMEKILGPEKYTVVDRDIKDGLLNILSGGPDGEKFSNLAIKTKVFLEKLKEGQKAFLDWLKREVVRISEIMNFKNVPELEIETIDMEDPNLKEKTFVRLYELGFLTPEDLIYAFKTGLMPDIKNLITKQEQYKKEREDKLWFPQLGGPNFNEDELAKMQMAGRPTGTTGTPKSSNKTSPRKSLSNFSDIKVSVDDIKASYAAADKLKYKVEKYIRRKMKIKNLNDEQIQLIEDFTGNVIARYDEQNWDRMIEYCYNNMNNLENTEQYNIVNLWSKQADLDLYNSSIIFHANTRKTTKEV